MRVKASAHGVAKQSGDEASGYSVFQIFLSQNVELGPNSIVTTRDTHLYA
jgi:hypothetical protein